MARRFHQYERAQPRPGSTGLQQSQVLTGTHRSAFAPAPAAAPHNLADSLQAMVRQLDAVRRIGCWDEDFAALMAVHHAGAQRLAAGQISQG